MHGVIFVDNLLEKDCFYDLTTLYCQGGRDSARLALPVLLPVFDDADVSADWISSVISYSFIILCRGFDEFER